MFKTFTILMVLSVTASYGQVKKTALEIKNEKLNAELLRNNQIITIQADSIVKLEKDIVYYKQTLNLLNSQISAENKDVTFKINSVLGDSSTGKITIDGIVTNNGVVRSIQTLKAEAFDPKGDVTTTYKMTVGNLVRIEKLLKDVPIKFTVELDKIVLGTPMIKALIIDFYSSVGYKTDPLNVIFQNLIVDWR